jgi:6-phosphogluconolactonase
MTFTYDAPSGSLTQQQLLSSLPPEFAGTNFASEVRVSSDGQAVYAANRLHDGIGIFAVENLGQRNQVGLNQVGEEWTRGDYPRSFTIDPTGKFLVSCNQRSDALTVYRIGKDRKLTFTDQYTPVGSPAVIVFLH